MIQKATTRAVLLGLIAALAVFVYANRTSLERCARTCECDIAGQHVTVPTCDPDLSLTRWSSSSFATPCLSVSTRARRGPRRPPARAAGVGPGRGSRRLAGRRADRRRVVEPDAPGPRDGDSAVPAARARDPCRRGTGGVRPALASYIPIEELKAANDPRWQEIPEQPEAVPSRGRGCRGAHRRWPPGPARRGGLSRRGRQRVRRPRPQVDDPLFFLPAYTSITRVFASSTGIRSINTLNEAGHIRHL